MASQEVDEGKEQDVEATQAPNAVPSVGAVQKPLEGWRLAGVFFSLALGLLLAIIETSITATALVSIGKYFDNSVKATWVVLAYLLSYMGFAIIFTRASDGIGRKAAVIIAYVLFAGFSLGGGLAQSLNQLIAFRVLQGIGGSGLYSMIMVIVIEIAPIEYWGILSGMTGMILAIGSVTGIPYRVRLPAEAESIEQGPLLGGYISERASWRWIYLYNAPCAVFGISVLLLSWPRKGRHARRQKVSLESLKRVDWLGGVLLLAASTLLVFALQEAGGAAYSWKSATIISTLTVSLVCWMAFFSWTFWLSFGKGLHRMRAIFPLTIALRRPTGPAILLILLTGFPYFVAVINLPQKFQIVNGDSPIMAGVRLLPLLCSAAFGSFVGAMMSCKRNFTSQTLIAASLLILLGCGLLSTLSSDAKFYKPTYGYQFILGFGVGLTISAGTALTNLANNENDVVVLSAAAQGALSQARMFGGALGLAMGTIILNNKLNSSLAGVLDIATVKALEQSLSTMATLSAPDLAVVAEVYSDSFNQQMRICTYLSAVAVVAAICTYQKSPVSITAMKEKQAKLASETD